VSGPREPEKADRGPIDETRTAAGKAAGETENPFCSRRVRPGAIAYQFPPGLSAQGLVERLRENGWEGEIVGPHGSGKSALLATLISAIRQAGKPVVLIELHDGQRRLPRNVWQDASLAPGSLLVIDGYEQLGRWSQLSVRRRSRRRNVGLLVTVHRSSGFAPLFHTAVDLGLTQHLVDRLAGDTAALVVPDEIEKAFSRHGGNLREVFFDLYDLHEARSRRG
jgi:hypothetical protein